MSVYSTDGQQVRVLAHMTINGHVINDDISLIISHGHVVDQPSVKQTAGVIGIDPRR